LVRATIDAEGNAEYEIVAPAAWDAIESNDALTRRAADARAIVFGSLAQRHETSRRTIERLWESEALMVFDANLRPPHDDRDVVKMSESELSRIGEWFGLKGSLRERTAAIAKSFSCRTVCVTRGKDGAALWNEGRWTEQSGYEVEVRDTVGAGDAFLAVLLAGLLEGAADPVILRHANLIGAYVASQLGAVPIDQPAAIAPPPAATRRGPRRR